MRDVNILSWDTSGHDVYTVYTRVHNALSGELAAGQPGELLTGMSGMPDIIVIDFITNHCCD